MSGKLRAQRAKSMKFKDGYMVSSGNPVHDYIDSATRHVLLRQVGRGGGQGSWWWWVVVRLSRRGAHRQARSQPPWLTPCQPLPLAVLFLHRRAAWASR